jgi:hypothetical protein
MRLALSLATLLTMFSATTLSANDGRLSQTTLAALGLSDMQPLTDAEGAQVRGSGGDVLAMSLSVVSGVVIDHSTKNFLFGSDANLAKATAAKGGYLPAVAMTQHISAIQLQLVTSSFSGRIIGGAGGGAFATIP